MVRRPGTHEIMIRVADDPIFGPVIIFGHGGLAADVIGDRAVALPPLNTSLARELISRTRIFRLLQGYGDCPPADIDALCLTLVQVSQMIIDLPQIAALEINPLLVDDQGVFAVDAQILIARPTEASERRLAIRPYPKELEEEFVLAERAHGASPADSPGGRTGASRLHLQVLARRPAAALLPLDPQVAARGDGPADADRLRPRDGVSRHGREARRHPDAKRWGWCARSPTCTTTRPSTRSSSAPT